MTQAERHQSVVLLLKDAIRNTDEQTELWPILRGLDLLWQDEDITDEDEAALCQGLLRAGWYLNPPFDPKKFEKFMRAVRGEADDDPVFKVFPGNNGEYFFHLQAGNGEILFTSEGYTRKADAKRGVVDAVKSVFEAVNLEYSAQEETELLESIVVEDD